MTEQSPRDETYFAPSALPVVDEETDSYFEPEEEEEEDALQEPGPAAQAVGHQTRYGKTVGTGDAESYFPARTLEEAETSLEAIADFCQNCPERDHCPEEACAVHRAEAKALTVLDEDEAASAALASAGALS